MTATFSYGTTHPLLVFLDTIMGVIHLISDILRFENIGKTGRKLSMFTVDLGERSILFHFFVIQHALIQGFGNGPLSGGFPQGRSDKYDFLASIAHPHRIARIIVRHIVKVLQDVLVDSGRPLIPRKSRPPLSQTFEFVG